MRALLGQTLQRTLDLRFGAVPLSGGTTTYQRTFPDGSVGAPIPAPEDPADPGLYYVELDATSQAALGLHQEHWETVAPQGTYRSDSWFILVDWAPGIVPRWVLRHRLANQVRDLTLGTAQSGSEATITDLDRWEPDGHWFGSECYLYGGAGRGQTRTISSSIQSGGILGPSRPWNPPAAAGTLYELHRRWRVAEYNSVLERAATRVRHQVMTPTEVIARAVRTDHLFDLPAAFDAVSAVEVQPAHGWTQTPERWTKLDPTEWRLVPGRRLYLRTPCEQTVRIRGLVAWDDLPSEDALIDGPTEYLVFRGAAMLLGARLTSTAADAPGYREQLTYVEETARAYEVKMRAAPNARRILP